MKKSLLVNAKGIFEFVRKRSSKESLCQYWQGVERTVS